MKKALGPGPRDQVSQHANDWARDRREDDLPGCGLQRDDTHGVVQRCGWCSDDPLYIAYHDNEWGVPARDDRHLFEMLILEGAQAVQRIRDETGSFADFVWSFADSVPRQNAWASHRDGPASTPESDALSLALKTRGCTFVGSTIMYSFMQAVGMVNDHETGCHRHLPVREAGLGA